MAGYIVKLVVIGSLCAGASIGTLADQAYARAKKSKEPAPVMVGSSIQRAPMAQPDDARSVAGKRSQTPADPSRQTGLPPRQFRQVPVESKQGDSKGRKSVKASRKPLRKVVVKPDTDLLVHGILENPQRYDPRPNHRTPVVQNPQVGELAQDHFLELDRNQDGNVDPVERAFGRLDMDRDLQHR